MCLFCIRSGTCVRISYALSKVVISEPDKKKVCLKGSLPLPGKNSVDAFVPVYCNTNKKGVEKTVSLWCEAMHLKEMTDA